MAYIDYEELILIAQEREEHPELGVPVWGNEPAVDEPEVMDDDFYAAMEEAYS